MINNAEWHSSLDGRMSNDDVCIDVRKHKDGSAELHFEFDAQEQAYISLTKDQVRQLGRQLQDIDWSLAM